MMTDRLNDFKVSHADWRSVLKRNQRRTRFVIVSFILIYMCVGLLIDLYLKAGHYPQESLSVLLKTLLSFQLFPIAALIAVIVAVIALLLTFSFHDKLMLLGSEYHEVTAEHARSGIEQKLYHVVEEMKVAAGLRYMPKIYMINANYMNAFASGYSEKSAMVAITEGLLHKLDRDELTAVIAHELSHIRHMDIKLTLFASVLSNITLIAIDMLFFGVLFGGGGRHNNREEGGGGRNRLVLVIMLLRYILPIVTILLMLYLSRTREYMADAGCVELMRDNHPLARALLKIHDDHAEHSEEYGAAYTATPHEAVRRQAYIFDPVRAGIGAKAGMSDFFSTHPGIKKRLAALGFTRFNRSD